MAKKIGIGIVLLAALGGFVAAIIKDKQQCEAAHGKVEIGKVEFEPHSGEYELRVNVVLERKAKLKSWKAVYGGRSFASDDAHGKQVLVRQDGYDSSRAGFLGSDLKRLYGADYKHRSFKFFVRRLKKDPPKSVELSGIFSDPVKGDIPFKQTIELK